MGTPPPLPVASPLAQPGSVGGPSGASAVGPLGPQSVGSSGPNSAVGPPASSMTPNPNQQPNAIAHLGAMRGSPSPAHSRSPTPHQTPPRLAGSQTPQPHTPNAPQLAPPAAPQPNQLGQGPGSNKSLQHMGPAGSTTPSHPGLSTNSTHASQLPRTPVSVIAASKLQCYIFQHPLFFLVCLQSDLIYLDLSLAVPKGLFSSWQPSSHSGLRQQPGYFLTAATVGHLNHQPRLKEGDQAAGWGGWEWLWQLFERWKAQQP